MTRVAGTALVFHRVRKVFRKGRRAIVGLEELTFCVRPGEAVALTGPNGAGKSTALRIAATLVTPTRGWARVCGHDVVRDARAARREVGVSLGSARSFYWRLTARHNLFFFAAVSGMRRGEAARAIEELQAELGLERWSSSRAGRLSRGALARLSVARALLHEPGLIVLDEPFASVDNEGRSLIWRALERRLARRQAVVLASHDAESVRRCDAVVRLGTSGRS